MSGSRLPDCVKEAFEFEKIGLKSNLHQTSTYRQVSFNFTILSHHPQCRDPMSSLEPAFVNPIKSCRSETELSELNEFSSLE